MGFIYLFTFGLCGGGQIFDLLLIPSLVAEANINDETNQGTDGFGFYISFNDGQPSSGEGQDFNGYSQYYVNGGNGGYVPPGQSSSLGDGSEENDEYVPPQQHSGFTMYINGQPVDMSNGGTIYMDESGAAQYYTNDDEHEDYHDFTQDIFRRQDESRRHNETMNNIRNNQIQESIRRTNENIRRTNEQNHRTHQNNLRITQQNTARMNDTLRMNQNMHNQNMQRMHQQNMQRMHQQNMNNIHRFRR